MFIPDCKSDCKLEFNLDLGLLEALSASNGTDGVSLVDLDILDYVIFEFPIG